MDEAVKYIKTLIMLEFKLESFSIKINIIIVIIDETVSIQRLFYEKAATDVIVLCI